jgi:hypothetical protein
MWTEQEYENYLKKINKAPQGVALIKQPKYHNKKVKVDGFLFDSQFEADYYSELKIQLRAGVIRGFCRQAHFILTTGGNGLEPMEYVADFIIFNLDGTAEIVDTKGFITDLYTAKKKVFAEKYPRLEIKEVSV